MNSSTRSQNERVAVPDLMKGIAVVLMIQVHLMEQFATEDLSGSAVGQISLLLGGPPAAPVFLAVMGYFVAHSRKSFAQLVNRGALLIGGGLLLNVGLNASLLLSISRGEFQLDPFVFIFGADILPLAGLSIACLALLRQMAPGSTVLPFVLALGVGAISSILPPIVIVENQAFRYFAAFIWSEDWWSYFPLIPWVAYPFIGFGFANALQSSSFSFAQHKPTIIVLTAMTSLFLIFTASYTIPVITTLPLYYHHNFMLILWISGFLFVWLMISFQIDHYFGVSRAIKYLKWLGRNVTSAYVFQWLIIGNIATAIYKTQTLGMILVWFIAVLIAVSLLILVYEKIRASYK